MTKGGWVVDSAGGRAPACRLAPPPLLRRLKPKSLHPVLNDGDTDGGVEIQAVQMHQVVELFIYCKRRYRDLVDQFT